MRRYLIALLLLMVAVPAWAQRGGSSRAIRNLLPVCTQTTGSCPSDDYFCRDSRDRLFVCDTPNNWTNLDKIEFGTTLPTTCTDGDVFQDTDATSGQQFYYCEDATWTLIAGGGSGSTTLSALTDTSVSSPSSGNVLIYDGVNSWDNKALSGDVTTTLEGAVTIAADAVALGTDTTGNYVDDATANGGLELTGTEGATLGLLSSCADTEVLKSSSGTWACASDAGAAGSADVGTVGDCTADPCFTATGTGNSLIFEGATADAFETTLTAADTTTPNKTITLPNETGTVCTTGSVCTGYEGTLTNEAGLETAVGGANVIVSTEIDTFAELDALAADKDLVNDDDAEAIAGVWTFQADPQIAAATPQLIIKDTDATAGDVNASIIVGCTNTGDGTEACDMSFEQQVEGTLVQRVVVDADGPVMVDGFADNVQLTVQGHSTQTNDIFVVEKGDSPTFTDMLTVSTTGTSFGDTGDGNRGMEFIDNTSACPDPTANNTTLCAVGGELARRDTGGTAALMPAIQHMSVTIAPGPHYDIDTQVFLFTVGSGLTAGRDDMPNGIIIDSWKISCNVNPTTDLDLDLKRADAWIGLGTATVMDVLDTTNGFESETTAANINAGATVANGQVIYLEFGTDPAATTCVQMVFEMWFYPTIA